MEFFKKLMIAIGVTSSSSKKVDFIADLPVEVAQHLLRMLDTPSLINASSVSRRWFSLCKSDKRLRQSVHHHLRITKHKMVQLMDNSRRSNKTRNKSDTNKKITSKITRRTDVAPTKFIFSETSRSAQKTSLIRASKKLTNTLQKPRITRSAATLRLM